MRPLTAVNVVTIWEQGQALHPIDRALLLLAFAWPNSDMETLQGLTVGQRNGRLLRLRQQTIGNQLSGLASCPNCQETITFEVLVEQLLLPEPTQAQYEQTISTWNVTFRLPTGQDLAALRTSAHPLIATARQTLLTRCLLTARQGNTVVPAHLLPEEIISQIAEAMVEADPQAEMRFALSCTDCGYEWSAPFDIVSFFWEELAAEAKRLLLEVHQIASAYGWREAEILAMSSQRRHTYLGFING